MISERASSKKKAAKRRLFSLLIALVFPIAACGGAQSLPSPAPKENPISSPSPAPKESPISSPSPAPKESPISSPSPAPSEEAIEEADMRTLKMRIDGREVRVVWEENEAVSALRELASASPLTIEMSMYGGFEQVGSLGARLPQSDVRLTTQPGDIVLYSGDRIVVFYGSNSWSYTRLGRIDGMSGAELAALLGGGDVELTLYV